MIMPPFAFSDAARQSLREIGLPDHAIRYLERPVHLTLMLRRIIDETGGGPERPKDTLEAAAAALRAAGDALGKIGPAADRLAVKAAIAAGRPPTHIEDWQDASGAFRDLYDIVRWGIGVMEAAAAEAVNPSRGRPAWRYYDQLLGEIAVVARYAGFADVPAAVGGVIETVFAEIGETVKDPRKMSARAFEQEPAQGGASLRAMPVGRK